MFIECELLVRHGSGVSRLLNIIEFSQQPYEWGTTVITIILQRETLRYGMFK